MSVVAAETAERIDCHSFPFHCIFRVPPCVRSVPQGSQTSYMWPRILRNKGESCQSSLD